MDNVYTQSYLKDFLNKVFVTNLDNKEISQFLSELVTLKKNHFEENENNYLIMLILTCINKQNLTYQNSLLINEIISSLLLDQLALEDTNSSCIDNNNCNVTINTSKKITLDNLDLNDNESVKAYFLQENKYLNNTGNFPYPQEGKTSIITSGDNMTIPGIRYIINYIIDHKGNIVGIQGYPRKELSQSGYEDVYSDLMDSIFKDDK